MAGILATCGKPLLECCCGVGGDTGIDMSKPGCIVIGALTMLDAVVTIRGICARGSTGTADDLLLYSGGIRLATGTGVSATVDATVGAAAVVMLFVVTGRESVFMAMVGSAAVTSKNDKSVYNLFQMPLPESVQGTDQKEKSTLCKGLTIKENQHK
jgi:hypothetical protein